MPSTSWIGTSSNVIERQPADCAARLLPRLEAVSAFSEVLVLRDDRNLVVEQRSADLREPRLLESPQIARDLGIYSALKRYGRVGDFFEITECYADGCWLGHRI